VIRSVTPFGDGAVLVDLDDVSAAHRLADRLAADRDTGGAPTFVLGSVVGYGTVVVQVEPGRDRAGAVVAWLRTLVPEGSDGGTGAGAGPGRDNGRSRAGAGAGRVVIPAVFDGPDLGTVAAALGATDREVVASLCAVDLEVAFLGFAPGFPYLVGLPAELASIPRRPTPRPSVPAGSVAVGGGFASVYPQSTPGGWMLLGRTSVPLFDRSRPPYALLRPGDVVRFTQAAEEAEEPDRPDGGPSPADGPTPDGRPPLANRGRRFIEVLDPGLLSLVEDHGRPWAAALGVPGAGPADPEALLLANRLMGNPDGAAAVELTAAGPTLRFHGDAYLAVVGAGVGSVDVLLDGRPVDSGTVVPVGDGQVVAVGRIRSGLRAYLAVSGGLDTPLEIGSRSSDVLVGLGPGPLRAGDRLDLGPPSRPRGRLSFPVPPPGDGRLREVRVLAGPHRLTPGRYRQLCSRRWVVGEASNRIGIRLVAGPGGPDRGDGVGPPSDLETGPDPRPDDPAVPVTIPSTGMVTGAVQVPPDGNPIVLMPDHATVGGYPVACCVISADLPVLGQLRPGDTVRLTTVDPNAAVVARERWEASLDERVSGFFPTATGT
jgi:biotin-dependent carboxylase-like uncharacterized protein